MALRGDMEEIYMSFSLVINLFLLKCYYFIAFYTVQCCRFFFTGATEKKQYNLSTCRQSLGLVQDVVVMISDDPLVALWKD